MPRTECNNVPRQVCQQVPDKECITEPKTDCKQVPRQVESQECKIVPREVSSELTDKLHINNYVQVCLDAPDTECKVVTKTKCEDETHQVCNQECQDFYWCKVCT